MAKKYIFANSAAYNGSLYNLPKGVTVLEFDTETNSLGIYNDKKAIAAIPVQPEKDNDNNFEIPKIPEKLSELQNDKAFITLKDVQGKLNNIVIPTKLSAFENDKKFISTSEAEAKFALKTDSTSFLQEITYNEINKVLSFIFKLSDGTLTTQDISISDLVDVYTAGDNIKIEGNKISFTGVIPSVSDFITINDVNNALINYAKKQDIPAIDSFITIEDVMQVLNDYTLKTDIPTKLSDFQNDTKFITLADVPTEYTAFEVMPNKVDIDDYAVKVPACTVHKFTLRSAKDFADNDVVIDWGDGTIEAIKDGKYEWKLGKQYDLSHDYSSAMTKDVQTFIVKIYGKDYYTFRNNSFPDNNLISRIFDVDLPIASHIGNFASMCLGATRLINVTIPHSTKYVTTAFNFSSTFESAVNLVSVTGFEDSPLRCDCLISNIFNKCKSLTTTDFAIPSCALSIAGIFAGCPSLVTAKRLIPLCGVLGAGKINISNAWLNVPAAITATVPQSLGGTLAE